jgi:hypothetical protein
MFMFRLRTKFHTTSYSNSLVIAIRQKPNENVLPAVSNLLSVPSVDSVASVATASHVRVPATILLLLVLYYKFQRCGCIQQYNVHTKLCENVAHFLNSSVQEGTEHNGIKRQLFAVLVCGVWKKEIRDFEEGFESHPQYQN